MAFIRAKTLIIAALMDTDRPHPQFAYLEQRIAYFLANPQFDHCVIVDPESQSIVHFKIPLKTKRGFRDEKYGRIMEVELTPEEATREELMGKIGFRYECERRATWDGVRNSVFPKYIKETKHPKQAAEDVVWLMEKIFLPGQVPWLWTFHVNDPNQWPDPLPRPAVWPPG